jgi:adenylate cyclase
VVGDAMMAIWSAPQGDISIRRNACAAALEITRAIGRANSAAKLPTRIGLHAGQLVMSHVGAIDHYEYRAVGDIVNTAARIENLNKSLGTSILASQEVLDGLDDFICRDLGVFQLQGKQQSLRIFEIIGGADAACRETLQQLDSFSHALAAWQQGDRQSAKRQFEVIQHAYPHDGPTRYYLSLCHACDTAEPRDPSDGKLSS